LDDSAFVAAKTRHFKEFSEKTKPAFSASVAAKARHFEEFSDRTKFALRTVDCSTESISSPYLRTSWTNPTFFSQTFLGLAQFLAKEFGDLPTRRPEALDFIVNFLPGWPRLLPRPPNSTSPIRGYLSGLYNPAQNHSHLAHSSFRG
jgi:hypothetical protein